MIALGACATEPEHPTDTEPAPTPEATADATDGAIRAVPLAEISVPTADGTGAYRFAFFDTGGSVATSVNVPFGQPVPVPDDCALTTFLRIADADAVVPPELLAACASASARTAGPLRVRDLGVETRGVAVGSEVAIADCAHGDFDARTDELVVDAAYRPSRYLCTRNLSWDGANCFAYSAAGNLIGGCTYAETAELQDASPGWYCSAHDTIPDPACTHDSWVYGDFGPYEVWTRWGGPVTKVRVETSVCNASALTRWKQKVHSGDEWGPSYYDQIYTGLNVLTLSAGWDGDDDWKARYFSVLVSNIGESTIHINNAWANLSGKNRFLCPVHI